MPIETFTPNYEEIEEILDFPVLATEFANESEQRALTTAKKKIGFRLRAPFMVKTEMQTYRTFFIARYGNLTGFYFENPNDDITYTVRFIGGFKTTYTGGGWVCEYVLKVINEDEA